MFAKTTVISLSAVILTAAGAVAAVVASGHAQSQPQAREIEITVENGRYSPARVTLKEGEKVRLKFVRKEHNPCTKEVVFPALNIKRELPTNQPVYVDLPELAARETRFQCGMNMVKGSVLVEAKK